MIPYREFYNSDQQRAGLGQQQGGHPQGSGAGLGAWQNPGAPMLHQQPPQQQQQGYWPAQSAAAPSQVYIPQQTVHAPVPQPPTTATPIIWGGGFNGAPPPQQPPQSAVPTGGPLMDAFPSFVPKAVTPQPPTQSMEAVMAQRGGPPFYGQSPYDSASGPMGQQSAEVKPPTAGATLVAPPFGLRSAINAPQFVPKPTPPPPASSPTLGPSMASQQQRLQPGLGNLKSTAAAFEPGANLNRLAVQAAPFVPGSRSKSTDGLSTTAAPFQPGGGAGRGGTDAREPERRSSAPYGSSRAQASGGRSSEANAGSGYFPADEGYVEEDAEEGPLVPDIYGDDVFDWSMGASSMPAPPRKTVGRLGVPEQLRQFFLVKDLDRLRALPADDERYKELPAKYHLAYPLDDEKARGIAGAFGYPSLLYKVVNQDDGNTYALRRFDNVRTTPKIVQSTVETWRSVQHPNIIRLCRAFMQHGALFFVHEYHPLAQSVYQRYILPRSSGHRLPEKLLWSFIVQLLSAIRAVHASGAACRMIHPNYVLLTSGNRIRLGCMGIVDVLESETRKSLQELQKDDLFYMGRLIVMLATRTFLTPQNFTSSLASIGQAYSPEFHNLVVQLCTSPPTVFDLTNMLTRHIMDEMDRQYVAVDDLETHLSSEYENGRLFRLSMKLAQLIDQPTEMDPAWTETGDKYILKLFRDYVYHQVDEEGHSVVDFGHVVHSLNKLDTGDPEKIVLMSRDQQSMIIVSFEDVKRCLENAWVELCSSANTAPTAPELSNPGQHHAAPQHHHGHHHDMASAAYLDGASGLHRSPTGKGGASSLSLRRAAT